MIWQPIPGWPEYEISESGDVRRVRKGGSPIGRAGRVLRQNGTRYVHVTLHRPGLRVTLSVHRLVCEVFHGAPPSDKHFACHHDGNRRNNHHLNLGWKLPVENSADRTMHGNCPKGDTHPSAKLTSADIADIFAARRAGRTQYAIAAMAGISQTHVSRILRGEGRR